MTAQALPRDLINENRSVTEQLSAQLIHSLPHATVAKIAKACNVTTHTANGKQFVNGSVEDVDTLQAELKKLSQNVTSGLSEQKKNAQREPAKKSPTQNFVKIEQIQGAAPFASSPTMTLVQQGKNTRLIRIKVVKKSDYDARQKAAATSGSASASGRFVTAAAVQQHIKAAAAASTALKIEAVEEESPMDDSGDGMTQQEQHNNHEEFIDEQMLVTNYQVEVTDAGKSQPNRKYKMEKDDTFMDSSSAGDGVVAGNEMVIETPSSVVENCDNLTIDPDSEYHIQQVVETHQQQQPQEQQQIYVDEDGNIVDVLSGAPQEIVMLDASGQEIQLQQQEVSTTEVPQQQQQQQHSFNQLVVAMKREGNAEGEDMEEGDSDQEYISEHLESLNPGKGVKNKLMYKNPRMARATCEFCGYKSSKEGVARHKQRRHPKNVYNCEICLAKFGVKYDMRRHRMNHFDEEGYLTHKGKKLYGSFNRLGKNPELVTLADFEENFEPPDGDADSERKDDIILKQNEHGLLVYQSSDYREKVLAARRMKMKYPPKDTSMGMCPVCNKMFPQRVLSTHQRVHSSKNLKSCSYGCGFTSNEKYKMSEHVRAKHIQLWCCHLCQAHFSQKMALESHLEETHGGPIDCHICGRTVSSMRYLQIHMQREHKEQKRHFCTTCKEGFFEKNDMIAHSMIHISEDARELMKEFQCAYCPKQFLRRSVLAMHEASHTGDYKFQCKQCGKKFAYSAQLHKHKKSHSQERNHPCQLCDKSFKFPYKLTQHMITHTRDRKHACDDCDKIFTSNTSLKNHRCRGRRQERRRLFIINELGQDKVEESSTAATTATEEQNASNSLQMTSVSADDSLIAPQPAVGPDNCVFMCGFCEEMFATAELINAHIILHGSEESVQQDGGEQEEQNVSHVEVLQTVEGQEQEPETELIAEEADQTAFAEEIAEGGGIVYEQSDIVPVMITPKNEQFEK